MIHILLLILKIIGIVLAVILGILVLLICIVLFVPIRYQVSASCDGSLEGLKVTAKVSWLLHLIGVRASYVNKEVQYKVHIAWKKMNSEKETEESSQIKEEEPRENEKKDDRKEYEMDARPEETKQQPDTKMEKADPESCEELKSSLPKMEEKSPLPQRREEEPEEADSGDEKKSKITVKIKELWNKIQRVIQKIKCTFSNICDKIEMLLNRKDTLVEFAENEAHRSAVLKAKKEAFRLLGRLKPKKVQADIHYGFEDPCLTGQVLAGLGVIYPFIGGCTNIVPDFEQKVLEGSLYIKGNIRLIYLIIAAWNMVWCKDVRTTYKDVRNFKW